MGDVIGRIEVMKAFKEGKSEIAGPNVRFIADNSGTETHELVLLKDGKEIGEVEGLQKNHVESMSIRLEKGNYELACLIVEKENGKTEDHYSLGMHTKFEVK